MRWIISMASVALGMAAHGADKIDFSACNTLPEQAGARLYAADDQEPFFRISDGGRLEFNKDHPRTMLVSSTKGAESDELTFFEYAEREARGVDIIQGGGTKTVLRTTVKLIRKSGRPDTLEVRRRKVKTDQPESAAWSAVRKALAKVRAPQLTGQETEAWAKFGYAKGKCFVAEEGNVLRRRKLVTFDAALCTRIFHVTDRSAAELARGWRSEKEGEKRETRRLLQRMRDAIVQNDEQQKARGRRLLAADIQAPEHALPGAMPEEEASALRERTGCEARREQGRLPELRLSREDMNLLGEDLYDDNVTGVVSEPAK